MQPKTQGFSRGVDRFFNNVLSNLASVGIITVLYLNYLMFETYITEFLFAFIFSEALWDTKSSMTNWLANINSISLEKDTTFSLRFETLQVILKRISAFSFNKMLNLNTDSSDVYIQTGLLIVAFVVKPDLFYLALGVLGVLLVIVTVLNNRLLACFRVYRYIGMTDDTFAAAILMVGIVCLGLLFTGAFAVIISKDVKLLVSEFSLFVDSQMKDDASWANAQLKYAQSLIMQLSDNVDSLESSFDNRTGWGKAVTSALEYLGSVNLEFSTAPLSLKDSLLKLDSVCVKNFHASFNGVVELFHCFREDFGVTSVERGWEYLQSLLSQTGSVLLMSSALPILLLDMGFRLVFFQTILFLLLSSKETVLQSLIGSGDGGQMNDHSLVVIFEEEVQRSMEAVLILPIKLSILNALATTAVLFLFDIQVRYVCASAVFLFSMFPIISPYLVVVPWILFYIAAYSHSYTWGAVVFLVHYAAHYVMGTWVLIGLNNRTSKRSPSMRLVAGNDADSVSSRSTSAAATPSLDIDNVFGKREYVTSLSMFFGLVTFGPKGIVTGPFLFCLATICHRVYANYRRIINESCLDEEGSEGEDNTVTSFPEQITPKQTRRHSVKAEISRSHSHDPNSLFPHQDLCVLKKMKTDEDVPLRGSFEDSELEEKEDKIVSAKKLVSDSDIPGLDKHKTKSEEKKQHDLNRSKSASNLSGIEYLTYRIAEFAQPPLNLGGASGLGRDGTSLKRRTSKSASPLRHIVSNYLGEVSYKEERLQQSKALSSQLLEFKSLLDNNILSVEEFELLKTTMINSFAGKRS